MKLKFIACGLIAFAVSMRVVAADKQADESAQAPATHSGTHLKIVDLTDSTLYDKLQRDELVRITAHVPSGGSIDLKLDGPAKLEYSADIETIKMGMPLIGVLKREYVIRHTLIGSGQVKAVVSSTAPSGGNPSEETYHFEWK